MKEAKEAEEFTGRLQTIRFQDASSGFVIAAFVGTFKKNEGLDIKETLTAKGNMLNPQQGLTYKLQLKEAPANKYGQQYVISSYQTMVPMDRHGIFKYITRVCKYVGVSTGSALVDKYGVDTIDVMKKDPQRIANEIHGITPERALEIQTSLLENEKNERIMVELENLLDVPGMRKDLPAALIKEYKSNAAEIVKADPYVLTHFHGIGFIVADQVAIQRVGYSPSGGKRIEAGVKYIIKSEMETTGSTWISGRVIEKRIKELIPCDSEKLEKVLKHLEDKGLITNTSMFIDGIKTTLWAVTWIAEFEAEIAERISQFTQQGAT